MEGFCERRFPVEGFVLGGILPQSHIKTVSSSYLSSHDWNRGPIRGAED